MEIARQNGNEKTAEWLYRPLRSILEDIADVDKQLMEAVNVERLKLGLNDYETRQNEFRTYRIRKPNLMHLHRAYLFDLTLVANLTTEPLHQPMSESEGQEVQSGSTVVECFAAET